jgi:hypothetical protein
MIGKKKPRTTVLYARVSQVNRDWVHMMANKLGYSASEFLDKLFSEVRVQRVINKAISKEQQNERS